MAKQTEEKELNIITIALLGDYKVGKSSIIKRYTIDEFDQDYKGSNGPFYYQKILELENKNIQLDIWDLPAYERCRSTNRLFYKNANVICLVYDITNSESLINLKEVWYNDIKSYGEKYEILAVVGNKIDLYKKEEVEEDNARNCAESIGAAFMLISAKSGYNVELLFRSLIRQYIGHIKTHINFCNLFKYYSL